MAKVTLQEEKKLWKKGFRFVVGLDESGRGPLAGPVVAAAVLLDSKVKIHNIRDPKRITSEKRREFYQALTNNPGVFWGVAKVSPKVIDKINIKNASELAMEKALFNLEKKIKKRADFLIIDGNHLRNLKLKKKKYKLVVKADEKILSCLAAGLIAKVWRDKIMVKYHAKYPRYGFNKHNGYPTKYHIKRLRRYGKCAIHRDSFKYGRTKTKAHKIKKEQKKNASISGKTRLG